MPGRAPPANVSHRSFGPKMNNERAMVRSSTATCTGGGVGQLGARGARA